MVMTMRQLNEAFRSLLSTAGRSVMVWLVLSYIYIASLVQAGPAAFEGACMQWCIKALARGARAALLYILPVEEVAHDCALEVASTQGSTQARQQPGACT